MKKRDGFVSNSSSSSFTVELPSGKVMKQWYGASIWVELEYDDTEAVRVRGVAIEEIMRGGEDED